MDGWTINRLKTGDYIMKPGQLYKVANIIGFNRGKPNRFSLEVIYPPPRDNTDFTLHVTYHRLDLKKDIFAKCNDIDISKFEILYGPAK